MGSPVIPICFRSLGLRKRAKYWAFRLISVLYFPLGNMFCNNKITLAFRWRPCVNNRDTTGLSVASAIKSSRMMMLLLPGVNFTLIFRQFGHTSFKPDAFSKRCFQIFVTFLPLIVVPKNTNSFLLFVHNTIMLQNLLDNIGFFTLCRTHDQK